MNERPATRPQEHIAWLDGVRGIAIALVMVFHFELLARRDGAIAWDAVGRRFTNFGWAGVDLFFILSGFLITGILADARNSSNRFRNFYARRALRIAPLYVAFLAGLFIVLPALHAPSNDQYQQLRHGQAWFWLYLTNVWILLRNGVDASLFGTGHLWSLSVEEQFYLVWPAVVFFCTRRTALAVCGIAMIDAPILRLAMHATDVGNYAIYTFTPARMDALAAGAAIALLLRTERGPRLLAAAARPVALLSAVYLVALIGWLGTADNLTSGMELAGLTPVLLLWAGVLVDGLTRERSPVRRACNAPALRWLGRRSYAMYIFHWPIAVLIATHFGVRTLVPGSPSVSELAFFALAGSATALASIASWHLLEHRFLRLKRFFEPRTSPEPDAPTRTLPSGAEHDVLSVDPAVSR